MIEMLIGDNEVASKLKDQIIFKIIPMMNPDGVFLGNYRSTILGVDLNRKWGTASELAHPALHATRNMILELNKAKWCELDLVLDLHCTTNDLGTSICGNSYDDVYRHERHIVFPKMLSHACEDFSLDYTIYNRDPHKVQTARRWMCNNTKDSVNAYSIHTSLLGFRDRNTDSLLLYTEESYVRIGRNLVRAILDYYQFLGIIPFFLPDALPLHDLPRLRPGSPASSAPGRTRVSSAQARQTKEMSKPVRKYSELASGQSLQDKRVPFELSEASTESSSSKSKPSSDLESDRESDGSGLHVEVVPHLITSSDTDQLPPRYLSDGGESEAKLLSFGSSKSAKILQAGRTSMRQPKANRVHLFLGETSFEDDSVSLPSLPFLQTSLPARKSATERTDGKQLPRMSNQNQPKSPPTRRHRRPGKAIVWSEPLAKGDPLPTYRYFDFKRMTRSKIQKKRRRKRSVRSPSSSRSRSRSRPRPKLRLRRKPRRKGSRRHRRATKEQDEMSGKPSDVKLTKKTVGGGFKVGSSSVSGIESASALQGSKGIHTIHVNELTIGGYKPPSREE